MCDLMMGLTLLGTIGSTVMGAYGQMQQGEAAAQAAEYNAKVGEMNATLAERRARDAIERGNEDERRKRAEVQQIMGRQKAAMAANGVDLTFGSPLDTIVDTAVLGELDALTIRSNTYREAYEHEVDATNRRAGAQLNRMEGASALQAGRIGAAGTVLTGFGQVAKQWSSFKAPSAAA